MPAFKDLNFLKVIKETLGRNRDLKNFQGAQFSNFWLSIDIYRRFTAHLLQAGLHMHNYLRIIVASCE